MNDKPGYLTNDELWGGNPKILKRFMDKTIPFYQVPIKAKCLDIGDANPQMDIIKHQLQLNVDQYTAVDLNFSCIMTHKCYDVIFALGIVEHLQNPLWFLNQLKNNLKYGGSIYLNIPCNPRWLWTDHHYHEMNRKHLEKWLLTPLGLKIVRYKKIWFVIDWRSIFIGIRPLLKVFRGQAKWTSLVRGFMYVQWGLYEIKKP